MGILVALIGVAIIAAVVVASFTAVLGGVIGGELEDEGRIVKKWAAKNSIGFSQPPFYYSSNVSFNLSMNPFFLALPFDSEAGSSWFSVFPVN